VTLAVHVANPSSSGWLFVDPSDAASPTAVAMLYNSGQDTTNTVVVEPGPDGRIRLESLAAADVSIDVLGWHSDADAPAGGLLYEPAPEPVRVLSTTGTITGSCTPSPCGRLAAWTTTTIQITGVNGVPTQDISAVNVVVHAINPAGAGWRTLWPAGSQMPAAAQLAYDAQYSSALVTVPVSQTGSIELFTANATDVAFDVVGWYGPATTGEGLVAHDVPAQLITDTRSALGTCDPSPCARLTAGQTTTTKVAGTADIPADADAVAVVLHAVNPDSTGYLVASSPTEPTPGTASLTFSGGAFVSGAVAVPVDTQGNIALWSTTPVDIIVQTVGWYEQATRTWTYSYTGDGLRRTKTTPDGTTTTFAWDRSTPVALLLSETIDAPGTQDDRTIRYLHGPGGLVTADITTPSNGANDALRWYHHDQLGSTRTLTDTTGTITGAYTYIPHGQPTSTTGAATTPIGWAGEYRDTETGFIYLRARYYDPTTAQFLTRDPIEALTRSPYAYANNDPINTIDPSGLCPMCVVFIGGALIGGGLDLGFQALGNVADGCGAFSDINWGSVAFSGLLGGGLSVGGAWLASARAAQGGSAFGDWAFKNGVLGADSFLFGSNSLGATTRSGLLNPAGRGTWRLGWSVNGRLAGPTIPGFRLKALGSDRHLWFFHATRFWP
jgi:RHS repeat-associated protein